ncbi:MAG: DUF1501 domain-containing protein [Verrucomicrobiae bacterium]|nr:DUF1501 domain-containing protein [Verrucomicrobiae bacterium]
MWTEPLNPSGPALATVSRRRFVAAGAAAATLLPWYRPSLGAEPHRLLAPRAPMHAPRATSLILIVTQGGMSQMDTFDPKPELDRCDGKLLTPEILPGVGEVRTFFGGKDASPLMRSPYRFAKHGQSGMDVSELFPQIATRVDDLCFVRSLTCDSNSHTPALFQLNTGTIQQGFPSLGSWLLHGLGSGSPDLPGFCVMVQKNALVNGGPSNWGAGFLGATYQGTYLRSGTTPILHLEAPDDFPPAAQLGSLALLRTLNREHERGREEDSTLSARMASYDLAMRMQARMPEAVDLSRETEATRRLYGLEDPDTEDTGRKCLLARRLVERGVRVVQVYSGSSQCGGAWDAHSGLKDGHRRCAKWIDRPIAALIEDLKQRGLLEQTLVVGVSEFGRMPISQGGTGRDHNPGAQTAWLAGAGIRAGTVVGATDSLGYRAVESPYHLRDLHATILHLMGLDDRRLTHYFNGRDYRLTENGGTLIRQALA